MGFDDGLDQAESEAEAAFRAAVIAAKQPIPDARQLVRGNADPGVADPEQRAAAGSHDTDGHSSTGRRVLDGVVDQVGGDLLQPDTIAGTAMSLGIRRRVRASRLWPPPRPGTDQPRARRHRRKPHGLAPQGHRAALGFRDVHQRVEHDEHPVGLLDAVGERFAIAVEIGRRGERQSRPMRAAASAAS